MMEHNNLMLPPETVFPDIENNGAVPALNRIVDSIGCTACRDGELAWANEYYREVFVLGMFSGSLLDDATFGALQEISLNHYPHLEVE